MDLNAYLARQPILDRNGKLFAYELLFRDSPFSQTANIQSGMRATAKVLENALSGIGLSALLGAHKGFLNCSQEMLLGKIPELLDPKRFVLEILEDVLPDSEIIENVKALKKRGFELALDDFIFNEKNCELFAPYFPYISYIKIDLVENSPTARKDAALYFKALGISVLAEKLETAKDYADCLNEGYDFFQGFFFAKPELLAGEKIPAETDSVLHLLRILRLEPTLDELCEQFSQYPALTESLLRYVNTVHLFKRKPIQEIREALSWIGIRNAHEWLMLLLYSRMDLNEDSYSKAQESPLFRNVSHRAKFMENVALATEPTGLHFAADAFLVGILSRLDALSQVPLDSSLPVLSLEKPILDALLKHQGKLGLLLRLTEAVESDNQREITTCLQELSVSVKTLHECEQEAFAWAVYA